MFRQNEVFPAGFISRPSAIVANNIDSEEQDSGEFAPVSQYHERMAYPA